LQKSIPYEGILARGQNAIVSSATGLGFLWSYLDKASINLDSYEKAIGGEGQFYVVKDLPKYQWNHQTRYWHESRASRKMLHRRHQVHGLLGDVTSDSAPYHMSWRNLLREGEMEWVAGHRVQGQTVFPAAGYLTVALEAARVIAENKDQSIRLIDIKDFVIHQAVPFSSDDAGIEALTSMAEITEQGDLIRARYTYSAALDAHAEDLTLIASADIEIRLGEPSESLLPTRKPALPHVVDVEPDRFYAALADLGYNFSGRFRSLSALRRKYYKASCQIRVEPIEEGADNLLIHPAELDATLQGIILAYSYPYDEELRTLHLPTSIQHIRVNPALLGAAGRTQSEQYDLDSFIVPRKPGQRGISGHVDLYSNKSSSAAIQIQGAEFMPLGGAAAEEDRRLFSSLQWVNDKPDGEQAHVELPENFRDTVLLLERIATYYLRQFHHDVPAGHPARSEFTTKWYLNFARHIIESGYHKWAQKEWVNDKLEDIMAVSKPFMHLPDVEIMHLIGRSMPRVFNEETTILEELRATDVLDRYYAGGFGLGESARWVGRTVKQITDRYPHMNVLEIGELFCLLFFSSH
jgi:acyl transferase domain-containing protein